MISFARGAPAPEAIAVELLADCARAAIEKGGAPVLSYGPGGGYPQLREWLAARHGVEAARVIVTNGGLQGFVFTAAELLSRKPGRVLVEAPTYDRPLTILAAEGAEVTTVPVDDAGLDPDALEAELRRGGVSFLYTIPTFQNPSGVTLATERRRRVAELAAEHDLTVLEDDPYGLVRYEGEAPPSLLELEGGARTVYTSSFSKTVAPGMRIGWFVLPADLAAKVEARAVANYISPPFLTQATVFELIDRGEFEPNLARIKELLRARRDAMLEALDAEFPEGTTWSRPEGGYFLWVEFPQGTDTAALLQRAEAAGVTFVRGSDFFPASHLGGTGGSSSARLAFSFESPERIREGVALLASLL
jgi:2-aminoadipate transaminase